MKIKKRAVIVALLVLIFLLGAVFPGTAARYVLNPAADGIWKLLRNSVFLPDQAAVWYFVIILCAVILTAFIFARTRRDRIETENSDTGNLYLEKYTNWKLHLPSDAYSTAYQERIRPLLTKFIVSQYAARMHLSNDYRLMDEFKNRRTELPDTIYTFLFPPKEDASIKNSLRKLVRKVSGREGSEYRKDLTECIKFIENNLENHND